MLDMSNIWEEDLRFICQVWSAYLLTVFFVLEEEKKDEPDSYVTVTIDTKHKAKDHYNVHEQLGVWVYKLQVDEIFNAHMLIVNMLRTVFQSRVKL